MAGEPTSSGEAGRPHRTALAETTLESLSLGAVGLARLLENLCTSEVDLRHRQLRLANAALRDRILAPLPASLDLLLSLGYELHGTDAETLLCLNAARHDPDTAARELRWFRELVDRRWQPSAWPCPACTLDNVGAAPACAVCEQPRPAWAAPPDAPRPRLSQVAMVSGASAAGLARAAARAEEQEEERRTRAEGAKRLRGERLLERERILAEARADRQRFAPVDAVAPARAPTPAPEGAPAPAGAPAPDAGDRATPETSLEQEQAPAEAHSASATGHGRAVLRVRFPDGSVAEETFPASDLLSRVFDWVDALCAARGEGMGEYALLQALPRRVFLREVLGGSSLAVVAVTPSAMLSVLRAADRGRVESGGVDTAMLTGNIEGLSYDELLELESRMDASRRTRPPAAHARETYTRVHAYDGVPAGADAREANERRCVICLENFTIGAKLRTLQCGHGFHARCVDTWFAERDQCPVCRLPLGVVPTSGLAAQR